jgi:hypothetical protein
LWHFRVSRQWVWRCPVAMPYRVMSQKLTDVSKMLTASIKRDSMQQQTSRIHEQNVSIMRLVTTFRGKGPCLSVMSSHRATKQLKLRPYRRLAVHQLQQMDTMVPSLCTWRCSCVVRFKENVLHKRATNSCSNLSYSNDCTPLSTVTGFVMAIMFMHEASVSEQTGLSPVHPTPGCQNNGRGSWPASDIH